MVGSSSSSSSTPANSPNSPSKLRSGNLRLYVDPKAVERQVTNEEIYDLIKQQQGSLEKALVEQNELRNLVNKQTAELSEQRAEIEVLQNIVMDKDLKVLELEDRLCKLEQYSRHSTFEIREVPVLPNERVEQIVINFAAKLGVPLVEHEIQAAHRLKANEGKTPGIIVQLASRKKRYQIVNTRKVITNLELIGQGSGQVYHGESLSPHYRRLLMAAKKKAKALNYEYVWWQGGVVRCRQAQGMKAFRIENERDLARIN